MDRGHGHRAVLGLAAAAVSAAALAAWAGELGAQTPSSPAPTATPWVQASTPVPAASPAKLPPRADKAPSPLSSVPPAPSPAKEDIARAMARKREEELARQNATASPAAAKPLPPRLMLPRLSPEEKEAYERNLSLWTALPSEEKKEIRGLANARIQEETDKAYESSGLALSDDQREVFTLRYRQERRRLERELQEKLRAERERRLPEIVERLKREFAGKAKLMPAPASSSTPTPTATVAPSPTAKS